MRVLAKNLCSQKLNFNIFSQPPPTATTFSVQSIVAFMYLGWGFLVCWFVFVTYSNLQLSYYQNYYFFFDSFIHYFMLRNHILTQKSIVHLHIPPLIMLLYFTWNLFGIYFGILHMEESPCPPLNPSSL